MDKKGERNTMEILIAWSTFALAVLTFALVIVAAVNFHKFIENVRLMASSIKLQSDSLKAQSRSIDLQAEGITAQTKSLDLQAQAIREQTKSIDLQAESLKAQAESVQLQSKDILLNYKPVVFIKGVIPPASPQAARDPYNCAFILTNSGKLPAREIRIAVVQDVIAGNEAGGVLRVNNGLWPSFILQSASVFPGSELYLRVPPFAQGYTKFEKVQLTFSIFYKGDDSPSYMHEDMKYIYSPGTNYEWAYVGPQVDIFEKEHREINYPAAS